MKKIGLVRKRDARAAEAARELGRWLTERGLEVYFDEARLPTGETQGCTPDGASTVPDVDLVVVLGGDGTLLYAARTMGMGGAPLLGVNMGGLGFLTEITLDRLYPTMELVLSGNYTVSSRMMLRAEVVRNGRVKVGHRVLNDAVINKGALARILELRVRIDGVELAAYRADGLIISTPTGSTAYNLAAGGPIVHPAHETIILTPICPFTLSNRPLILPVGATIEIGFDPEASDLILTSDGQVSCALEPEDQVIVRRAEAGISLIGANHHNYFEILRTKLGWG